MFITEISLVSEESISFDAAFIRLSRLLKMAEDIVGNTDGL
jgi:hypothetical protein